MPNQEDYEGREQTLVKHLILQHYLERFAHIIFSHWQSITYVDCFAGPWNSKSEKLEDSSFAIALQELRKARDTYSSKRPNLRLRCFFLEENKEACRRLQNFSEQVQGTDEIRVLNSTFEDSVDQIRDFVLAGGEDNFPFLFIDPTGWTGFALRTITPLLRLTPSEVLINFMTSHITRFLTGKETSHSFEQLSDLQVSRRGLRV